MDNNHLNDDTIQAFLLNDRQEDAAAAHLAACSDCRARLDHYRQLIAGIQAMPPETFSFDVTDLVMDTVIRYEQQKSRQQAWLFWGLLIFVLVVMAAFALPFISNIVSALGSMPVFTLLLTMGTGLAVLVYLLADIFRQHKLNETQIFENKLQPIL